MFDLRQGVFVDSRLPKYVDKLALWDFPGWIGRYGLVLVIDPFFNIKYGRNKYPANFVYTLSNLHHHGV